MRRLFAVFLLTALLCGCFSNNKPENNQKGGDSAAPKYGGTLKIYSYNSDTLNPLYTQNRATAQMLMLVFDYLIKCDEAMRPVPVLASGFDVSADGLIWNVHIKNGVSWHDGSALTANDVAATLNAVKSSPRNSPYKNNLANAVKIEAVGSSVRITLAKPQTNFISLLEIPIVKATDANTYDSFNPVGTGLYVFAQQTKKTLYLSANNSRWDEAIPYISSVEVHLLPDKSTAVFAFEAKEIDAIATDLQNRGRFSGGSESKSIGYGSGRFSFLAFNLGNKYLSDIAVRTALAHAVNKNRVFEEAILSYGVITDTFVSPEWWMYNGNAKKYTYDPSLAIKMLNDAQIRPNSITLELLVNDDNKIKLQAAEIITQNLKEIGIDASVKPVPWESFTQLVSSGAYDMYLGEINYSNEVNPIYSLPSTETIALLLDKLQLQITDEGRKEVYDEIQQEYTNILPSLPLYFENETLLYNNRIDGSFKPRRSNVFDNVNEWFVSDN